MSQSLYFDCTECIVNKCRFSTPFRVENAQKPYIYTYLLNTPNNGYFAHLKWFFCQTFNYPKSQEVNPSCLINLHVKFLIVKDKYFSSLYSYAQKALNLQGLYCCWPVLRLNLKKFHTGMYPSWPIRMLRCHLIKTCTRVGRIVS